MNTRFKVFASYNILQYLWDFIHVLIFCNCLKMPKKWTLGGLWMISFEIAAAHTTAFDARQSCASCIELRVCS
jgi:hypothetical protein